MDMSKAALPAISGNASNADKSHPLYKEWLAYESGCRLQMINGQDFKNWLYQREQSEYRDNWKNHPEFNAFIRWMRETQAGARNCRPTKENPNGLVFPENFKVWLTGERW